MNLLITIGIPLTATALAGCGGGPEAYQQAHTESVNVPAQGRVATVSEDSGKVTAPFDGRFGFHRWNAASQPVTITLRTVGNYTITGVV